MPVDDNVNITLKVCKEIGGRILQEAVSSAIGAELLDPMIRADAVLEEGFVLIAVFHVEDRPGESFFGKDIQKFLGFFGYNPILEQAMRPKSVADAELVGGNDPASLQSGIDPLTGAKKITFIKELNEAEKTIDLRRCRGGQRTDDLVRGIFLKANRHLNTMHCSKHIS